MNVPARLRWQKAELGFAAFPVGPAPAGQRRFAAIDLYQTGVDMECWRWRVVWDGWFCKAGMAESKQAAADKATEMWWEMVSTEVPRDVDLEAAIIAARALIQPPPNSLFGEDNDFLRKVEFHLRYAPDPSLPQIASLLGQLNEEMDRRREAGTLTDPVPYQPSHPVRRRRRR